MTTKVSEAVARPVRTAAQAAPAWVFTEAIDAFIFDMSDRQYGVMIALFTVLFSWIQNFTENKRESGYFLRDVPPKHVKVD